MNKLRIIKGVVFLLTFLIVFILCAGVMQVIKQRGQKNTSIELVIAENENIVEIFSMDDRIGVLTDQDRIHIINVETARVESVVKVQRSAQNGQEEKKEE